MVLRVKYNPDPARGVWRMSAGFAALLAMSYWALHFQASASAQQIEHRLIGLVAGGHLSGWLFLWGFRARRTSNGEQAPVSSQMAPAAVTQRAA